MNALSGIVTELPAKEVWGHPLEYERDIYLSGSQAFLIYQVNIAYAHCRDTDGQDSSAFCAAFEQVNEQQVLVSSIATRNLVAVAESQAVDVADWLSIKQAVLERLHQDALQFDRSVKDVPFYRYK
ncbi:hypothetical protein ACNFBR_03805 [Pseudomonas sp. NY11955]|uniref:hypothetical protein n=1 Tax=Pseudomonas sp. NY11955 TaxID=3400363 RepID=UPI003A8973DC